MVNTICQKGKDTFKLRSYGTNTFVILKENTGLRF